MVPAVRKYHNLYARLIEKVLSNEKSDVHHSWEIWVQFVPNLFEQETHRVSILHGFIYVWSISYSIIYLAYHFDTQWCLTEFLALAILFSTMTNNSNIAHHNL